MPYLCFIPTRYKEGTYTHESFHTQIDDGICLDYDNQYQILTYTVPNLEDCREITLYQISDKELTETLKVTYAQDGILQKITTRLNNRELFLYIHFTDSEHAKQELKNFAIQNADAIIAQIRTFSGIAARLFIEYFCDGDCYDFHAKIGTAAQKAEVEKEYPDNDDIVDNPGDYPMDYLYYGENDAFHIFVACADDGMFCYFQYAVDLMAARIREKTVPLLQKTEDFKFICEEYD